MEIRTLKANEIECRIGTINKDGKGLSLLLYKDARCDMNILDEVFGSMNWKREHCRDNRNCIVSIYDADKKEWVSKEDTGTESNTEAEKGLASDSFKRACFNWGIGRELYTAPFIWVSADKCNIVGGKCYDKFVVKSIEYNNKREISQLTILNEKTGAVVFDTRRPQPKQLETKVEQIIPATCECCGASIRPFTDNEKVTHDIFEMVERSKKQFGGHVYCVECVRSGRIS